MSEGLTESEKFVNTICNRSFLSLWTHPNPIGKKGKELCDCLIVCEHHIVIISVKDIEYKDTGDQAGRNRWIKDAVSKSAAQIWGAERWLNSVDKFVRHDGREVVLPEKDNRVIHRISVSLGAQRLIPYESGDLGNGIVHICDESSLGVIFGLLDTITDFVVFLDQVESLTERMKIIFSGGGIEDLLAIYLSHGYSFPFNDGDCLVLEGNIFKEFTKSEDYEEIQNSFKISYFWDKLLEHYINDVLTEGMFDYSTNKTTENQHALVQMALQPRGHRANLAEAYIQFLKESETKTSSRVVLAYKNTAFVFLTGDTKNRDARVRELGCRCLVVRGRLPKVDIVVGIARDKPDKSKQGFSSDLVFVGINEWTEELETDVERIVSELGYFKNAAWNSMPTVS